MATVLALDFRDKRLTPFAHLALGRIEAFAREHQPELEPLEFAQATIARLFMGDPKLLLIGIIDEETAALVGHVLAQCDQIGGKTWATIPQWRADDNVGDAVVKAVEQAITWAVERQGVQREHITLFSHRHGKGWEKKLGF